MFPFKTSAPHVWGRSVETSVVLRALTSLSLTDIRTWGTYWRFWRAQIWNRSPIFSSILKVSNGFLSHHRTNISAYHLISLANKLSHTHKQFLLFFYVFPSGRKSQIYNSSALYFHLPVSCWNVCRISINHTHTPKHSLTSDIAAV